MLAGFLIVMLLIVGMSEYSSTPQPIETQPTPVVEMISQKENTIIETSKSQPITTQIVEKNIEHTSIPQIVEEAPLTLNIKKTSKAKEFIDNYISVREKKIPMYIDEYSYINHLKYSFENGYDVLVFENIFNIKHPHIQKLNLASNIDVIKSKLFDSTKNSICNNSQLKKLLIDEKMYFSFEYFSDYAQTKKLFDFNINGKDCN